LTTLYSLYLNLNTQRRCLTSKGTLTVDYLFTSYTLWQYVTVFMNPSYSKAVWRARDLVCNILIYLLTGIGLTHSGISTVHSYTQTIQRTTQLTQTIRTAAQLTNWEECGPCPVFASYTLAFALQLRKKRGKTIQTSRWNRKSLFYLKGKHDTLFRHISWLLQCGS
jgi:hypothetical protein